MMQKLTTLFMDKENKDFFKVYAKYFPTVNKTLKLGRGGVVNVINNDTNRVESYKNWHELNYIYKHQIHKLHQTRIIQILLQIILNIL